MGWKMKINIIFRSSVDLAKSSLHGQSST
jgi:hypothetical protein